MSRIKYYGEYKLVVSFDVERDENTMTFDEIKETIDDFPFVLRKDIIDNCDGGTAVSIETIKVEFVEE